jgi:putative integral membrane protein (TIGR02587 family)
MTGTRIDTRKNTHPISVSIQEYARGAAGGLLFSLPLLYTMEMWEVSAMATSFRLLAGLAGTFVLLLGYNRYAGIRHDASFAEIAIDSIEELGLGLAGAAAILWVLGRITFDMDAWEIVSRIVVQGLVGAIGVSIGTAQLGGGSPQEQGAGSRREREPWSHLVLAACGAVLLAANVAPTEEIQVLGHQLAFWRLLTIAILSFGIGGVVLHYSQFTGSRSASEAGTAEAIRNAVVTYAVALVASAVLLWFFGRFNGVPGGIIASQTVVLGFAGALGASAGRLLLQV